MKSSNSDLFFSMTHEFLDIYMVKQLGRSPDTTESYRDALTLFRRYVLGELNISITKFTFAQCMFFTNEKYPTFHSKSTPHFIKK